MRAIIAPTKARVFYDKNTIRLPWQELNNPSYATLCHEMQRFFAFYTTNVLLLKKLPKALNMTDLTTVSNKGSGRFLLFDKKS